MTTIADSWSRSLQCAEHADRLASRLQRESVGYTQGAFRVIDWTNHYNRQESRCFVEIRYSHGGAAIANRASPPFSSELYDAVERVRLAGHTGFDLRDDVSQSIFCFVAGGNRGHTATADCTVAAAFILDKMTR